MKILWRSGYFRTFHLYFCQCLLSFCLPRWYSWSCRALFLARYFILLDYNTIKAVPIARLARYRFHSKITSIRRIAASISTYHVPVLKPLTTFYIALKRRRRKGKMKDYWILLFLFISYTDWKSQWGHFEKKVHYKPFWERGMECYFLPKQFLSWQFPCSAIDCQRLGINTALILALPKTLSMYLSPIIL